MHTPEADDFASPKNAAHSHDDRTHTREVHSTACPVVRIVLVPQQKHELLQVTSAKFQQKQGPHTPENTEKQPPPQKNCSPQKT